MTQDLRLFRFVNLRSIIISSSRDDDAAYVTRNRIRHRYDIPSENSTREMETDTAAAAAETSPGQASVALS